MKVIELIKELEKYNQQAEISVVVHCKSHKFSISFGSSEGVTKESCDTVSLYVDELCNNENQLNK